VDQVHDVSAEGQVVDLVIQRGHLPSEGASGEVEHGQLRLSSEGACRPGLVDEQLLFGFREGELLQVKARGGV